MMNGNGGNDGGNGGSGPGMVPTFLGITNYPPRKRPPLRRPPPGFRGPTHAGGDPGARFGGGPAGPPDRRTPTVNRGSGGPVFQS